MSTLASKLLSADEFYDFVHRPENRSRVFELERGEVIELSRPGKLHGFVCGNGTRILSNFAFARKKGYVCSNDTGIIVDRDPDTVRGPDIAFFEDVTTIEELGEKWADTPPRVSVEVLSPSDTPSNVFRRIREQIDFGVDLVWVVDPEFRNVTVYRRGQGRRIEQYTVEENEELTGEDVLPDFHCKVAEFCAFPGQ